ncbi:hypothetical protein K440DRAFT_640191 [Wilcoxina mikolae CBS 423.85]|nr:hypothetical protein K440DRAFT_640191 [Wilcoxina mikolae CBS 423.85]
MKYQNRFFIAKGTLEPEDIESVFEEVKILQALPRHPSIIPPPSALITIDKCMCGYLLEYYPLGNIRDYCLRKRTNGQLPPLGLLRKWAVQLASVLHHLLYIANFIYNDIKPDNFVIDSEENLILIDFSIDGSTAWTCPPEVFHGYALASGETADSFRYVPPAEKNTSQRPKFDGVPRGWPKEAKDKALVFGVGRSLWMM